MSIKLLTHNSGSFKARAQPGLTSTHVGLWACPADVLTRYGCCRLAIRHTGRTSATAVAAPAAAAAT
eukprot:272366-Chlamydomonas_euryale.AAC.2